MGDPKGFLKTARETPRRRPVDVRLRDWREVYEPFARERAEREGLDINEAVMAAAHG